MLEQLFELLIDRITQFTDYFIVRKYITLSETSLFAFCIAWFLWMVTMPCTGSEACILSRGTWAGLLGVLAAAHFVSFFMSDIIYRAAVVCAYAFLWCCLTLLNLYLGSSSPATPTTAVMMMMGVFIAVRLFRERRHGT